MPEESDVSDDNAAIDEDIRCRVESSQFGAELLAKGQSIVVLDEDGRVVVMRPSWEIESVGVLD